MGWCFYSHLLYFGVQTGTKTNLFLVVYVYEVVLLVASCTSVYKQAPKQTYLAGLYFFMFMGLLLVEACNLVYKRAPYKPEKNTYQFIDSRLLQHVFLFKWMCSFHDLLWSGPDKQIIWFDF